MPGAMHSPLSSPSIRAIAHAHPHAPLPRQVSGYFPPASPPVSQRYYTSPRVCASPQMGHYSPAAPCPSSAPTPITHFKHQHRDQHQYQHPSSPSPSRPTASRRGSLRESAIPLRPTPPMPAHQRSSASAEANPNGRRRPSFKIDLPPRQLPQELLAEAHPEGARPITMVKGTPHPLDYNPYAATPVFQDPFHAAQGDYIILHADDLPSPEAEIMHSTELEVREASASWQGAGLVGLGYSLNRMRAPTPWIRGKAEDNEWLTGEDVEEMERGMSRMAMA